MLASRLDNATVLSAADAWDGDTTVVFTAKGKTCLRATVAGKGPEGTATITNALTQWSAQMPPGSTNVAGAPTGVTLNVCDAGSATTPVPNKPNARWRSWRTATASTVFVKNGDSTEVASCTADTIVRDPVFAPVIEAVGNDPSVEPDPALVAAVGVRLREVRAQCQPA